MGRAKSHDVLVLNKSWQAITTVSTKEAFRIVFRGSGRIIEPESCVLFTWERWLSEKCIPVDSKVKDGYYLKTQSLWIRRPDIIVLGKFAGFPNKKLKFSRRGVLGRDGLCCQYCGCDMKRSNATIDHIHPVSKGGITSWLNCVACCSKCNHFKADRYLRDTDMELLQEPYVPSIRDSYFHGVTIKDSWTHFV